MFQNQGVFESLRLGVFSAFVAGGLSTRWFSITERLCRIFGSGGWGLGLLYETKAKQGAFLSWRLVHLVIFARAPQTRILKPVNPKPKTLNPNHLEESRLRDYQWMVASRVLMANNIFGAMHLQLGGTFRNSEPYRILMLMVVVILL